MISLSLDVPEQAARGRPVPIVLRVRNDDDRPAELYLQGRGEPAFDVVVRTAAGDVAWRRLEGAALQMVLQLKTLGPGETLELRDAWDQRDASGVQSPGGAYDVEAVLLTDGEPLRSVPKTLRLR